MAPDRQTILGFLAERRDLIDRAIARGCRVHSDEIGDWSPYEWEQSLEELGSLSGSRDAFYDRPTIGVAYGLWYHARRVNPLISEVERIIRQEADRGSQPLTLVDLGSGTGATSWAAALVTWAIRQTGGTPPPMNVHEVESSTFMRRTSSALWDSLGQEIGPVDGVHRHDRHVSWPEMFLDANESTWLIASYLLDHTDRHRRDEIMKSLCQVVDNCSAKGVIFTVSQKKRAIAQSVIDQLQADFGWEPQDRRGTKTWSGGLVETARARREIYSQHGLERHPLLAKDPLFHYEMPSVLQATREPGDEVRLLPFPSSSRWPSLNEDQEKAASSPTHRSVLLQGAAGSGKSIVLVERLAKIIERSRPGQSRSILVTSFNKDMIALLDRWFSDRMDSVGIRSFTREVKADGYIEFSNVGTGSDRVTFSNWDKAPTRLAGLPHESVTSDPVWLREAGFRTEELLATEKFRSINSDNVAADPEFQLKELQRVVYGLKATTKEKYLAVERTGRGQGIGQVQRALVWSVIESAPQSTFTHRRIRLLEKAQGGRMRRKFTDIFVDEAQDFLPADIECCYALRDGDNPVFMVVDQTQALHTGSSYQSPASPPGSTWLKHELHGSYRLPVTIANCIRSLGQSIQRSKEQEGLSTEDISLPNSRKASVIGVRPVVVTGDEVTLAHSIQEIRSTYDSFLSAEDPLAGSRGSDITICEKDSFLKGALSNLGLQVETTTIKKIKGLEREFLVWSTSSDLGNPDEWQESAYTICTRSSCVLVVAVDPSKVPDQKVELLGALDREYLMFWDRNSHDWWDQTVLET